MADRRLEMLHRVPLFATSNKRQLRGILEWTKEYEYRAGATIVKEGGAGRDLFVITDGKANVVRDGRTVVRLMPGDYFGEIGMIDGRPRTASVVADGPVRCVVIKQADFRQFINGEPEIAWSLLGALAARVRVD